MSRVHERQKQARSDLQELWQHPEQVSVIHYSCESFFDRPDGTSPRVTSIAVRNLKTAQTQSFSIHKYSELKGHSVDELEGHYDELEKEMLENFFALAKERKEHKWLHWNMRDENYGFHALELRLKILGGEPYVIQDANKYDLSRILIGIYGKAYSGHPRLESLRDKNKISSNNFKTGKEEADLFDQKNYVALHQSTLAKTDLLSNLCQLAFEGELKTNASWREVYGHSISAFMSWFSHHPIIGFGMIALSLLGNILALGQLFGWGGK
ncbi:hypothetical protein [Magnetospira sp. QH-2]|uniref:hypothetical protein n=1 Tax=Magnetospira sp. (strain QH-2) TaxID=1288970 RepID=UPI0003E80BE9|nr:hypothetical protein [Magnetospira sp. QH-2]CCQ74231.1 Conserved protein of unknown function [Magnetospira sp. QH-2]